MAFDYNSSKWRRFRKEILRRDNYRCRECRRYGRSTPATEVHHEIHADEWPELAYNPENCVSLCHACHSKKHPEKALSTRRR